jgi:hypothetical protein
VKVLHFLHAHDDTRTHCGRAITGRTLIDDFDDFDGEAFRLGHDLCAQCEYSPRRNRLTGRFWSREEAKRVERTPDYQRALAERAERADRAAEARFVSFTTTPRL